MTEAIEGRWCDARVVPEDLCAWREEDLIPCGGELLLRRRRQAAGITTYLVCQFCGTKTPTLRFEDATRQHTDLIAEAKAQAEAEAIRECYFCRRMRPRRELAYRNLGENVRGVALGCKFQCEEETA